jgi:protocatechuate 4,5-dioxygenase beta chain
MVGDTQEARIIPHIEYLRETGSEGIEMVMWLIMRGALGKTTRCLHRHYHIPVPTPPSGTLCLNRPTDLTEKFHAYRSCRCRRLWRKAP